MNTTKLPENYRLNFVVDFRNAGKIGIAMNIGTLVLAAAMIGLAHLATPFTLFLPEGHSWQEQLMVALSIVIGMFAYSHLRELCRMICFRTFSHQKTKYHFRLFSPLCSLPGYYFGKAQYLVTVAVPWIVMAVITGAAAFTQQGAWFWALYLVFVYHVVTGIKELYVFTSIKDRPDNVHILDEGMEIKCYEEYDPAEDTKWHREERLKKKKRNR